MKKVLPYVSLGLLAVVALTIPIRPLSAHTGDDEEFTCPLCSKTFESYVARSGTSFGCRLDFKEVGPIRSPWPVPRCSHCGFVIRGETLDEARKTKLRAFVTGDAYAPIWKKHTDYYCMGLIAEACDEKEPLELGTIFLKATWELKDTDERYPRYATKATLSFARVQLPSEDADDESALEAHRDLLVARYLQLELHRRCGAFEAAKRMLTEIAALDRKGAPAWYEQAIRFQSTLVTKRDKAPYAFSDLPEEEKAEDAKGAAADEAEPADDGRSGAAAD